MTRMTRDELIEELRARRVFVRQKLDREYEARKALDADPLNPDRRADFDLAQDLRETADLAEMLYLADAILAVQEGRLQLFTVRLERRASTTVTREFSPL